MLPLCLLDFLQLNTGNCDVQNRTYVCSYCAHAADEQTFQLSLISNKESVMGDNAGNGGTWDGVFAIT